MTIIYGVLLKQKLKNKYDSKKIKNYDKYYISLKKEMIEGNPILKKNFGKTLVLEIKNVEELLK